MMSMQKNLLKSGGDKRRNETKKEAGNIGYRRKRKYFKMRNEEKKERLSSIGWFIRERKDGKERTGAAIDEIDRFGIIRRLSRF